MSRHYRVGLRWKQVHHGHIPHNALIGGEYDGGAQYIGRAEVGGSLTPGKIDSHSGKCYIPWGCEEHEFEDEYQVLVSKHPECFDWIHATGDEIPPGAVHGGVDENDEPLYIGRAWHEGCLIPGKIVKAHACCYVPWGGAEHSYEEYEILIVKALELCSEDSDY